MWFGSDQRPELGSVSQDCTIYPLHEAIYTPINKYAVNYFCFSRKCMRKKAATIREQTISIHFICLAFDSIQLDISMLLICGRRSISTIPNSPLFTTLFLRIWAGSRSLRAWMYKCVRVCVYPVCSLSIFLLLYFGWLSTCSTWRR